MYALKSFFSIRCKKKKKTVLFSLVLHMVGPSAQVLVSVSAWPVGSLTNGNWRVWDSDVKTLQLVQISGSLGPRPPLVRDADCLIERLYHKY